MVNIQKLTIKEAGEYLRSGDITAVQLAQSYLDVIDHKNAELNAFVEVYDDVIEQAERADKMLASGNATPLTGIPIAVKDNILFEGHMATAASNILEGHVAAYDATAIAKLRDAGAVLLGRANMDDAAMGSSTEWSRYGVTRNPIDPTRVPGGSSGGSVAAVASGMALAALGSDTGGSVRQPAALCGVVGFKPTYGSVSRHGLIALTSSFDVIGPIAQTVSDVEVVYAAIAGKDPLDSTTVDATDYPQQSTEVRTIGVPRTFLETSGLSADVYDNFKSSLARLEELGYTIVDIELPSLKYSVPVYYIVLPAEASSNLARYDGIKYGYRADGDNLMEQYMQTRGKGFGEEVRRRIILGTYVLSAGYYDAYYNRALAVRQKIVEEHNEVFTRVDVIATPTTAGPAFKIGAKTDDPIQMYLEDIFTVSANLTGMPAISLPAGTVPVDGVDLPLGLQLVAPHMHEERLFTVGKHFTNEK